jgi:glycosyltransferase involved in cell wall biosynthesis
MCQETGRKSKIRILHLVHGLRVGGAEIALFHYIKALGMEGYEHYVYCFGDDGPVRDKIQALGVFVCIGRKRASIKQPIRFGVSLRSLFRDLIDFIETRHIQVIQSHSGQANQLGVAIGKLAGLPTFPTVHSTMAFVDPRNRWDLRVYLTKALNGLVYRFAEKVLTVSQEIKKIVLKTYGLKDSRVLVLKNGIVFNEAPTKTADLEDQLFLSENKFIIIAVGRLVALKCFDTLIKAAAEIVDRDFKNFLVLIAGEGEEKSRLIELVNDLKVENHVKLLGMRHDVLELITASDIFVIPSRFEGLSIAMIEAMACGLPVIASDAPGLREHVMNEENGLLFPVADYRELAEQILRLANDEDLRVRLSKGAKDTFNREYDMRQNIRPLDILFREYAHGGLQK